MIVLSFPTVVDSMPMSDSFHEAKLPLLLIEAALYPKIVPAEPEKIRSDEGLKGLLSALRRPGGAETRALKGESTAQAVTPHRNHPP